MKSCTLGSRGAVSYTLTGTVLLGLTSAMPGTVPPRHNAAAAQQVQLASGDVTGISGGGESGVALLMGGSGFPIPPPDLVQTAFDNYAIPKGFENYAIHVVFTPEGLQPVDSGIKSLPFDTSVAQGVTILNSAIKDQLEAGHNVLVGGVSQSATINALEMRDIANGSLGFQPPPGQLAFFNLGDPSNPNGGILERFDVPTQDTHPVIPSLGITFSGAAPADTGIPTDIYTLEYDGFADFPRYPINFLSDLNAVAGIAFVHPTYIAGHASPAVTPEQIENAQILPTTAGYDGGTTYYMMPFEGQLPLATLVQDIAGKPVADLLEPDLRVLVNLGYGPDPSIGWSQTPANVPTPMGLFPQIDSEQWTTIIQALRDGAIRGFKDFLADLSDPSTGTSVTVEAAPDPLEAIDAESFTEIVNAVTRALSQAYAILLPTADIINALTTTLPAYDVDVFTHYLQAGDLIDAIGMPAALNTGLATVAAGFESFVIVEALHDIQNSIDIF